MVVHLGIVEPRFAPLVGLTQHAAPWELWVVDLLEAVRYRSAHDRAALVSERVGRTWLKQYAVAVSAPAQKGRPAVDPPDVSADLGKHALQCRHQRALRWITRFARVLHVDFLHDVVQATEAESHQHQAQSIQRLCSACSTARGRRVPMAFRAIAAQCFQWRGHTDVRKVLPHEGLLPRFQNVHGRRHSGFIIKMTSIGLLKQKHSSSLSQRKAEHRLHFMMAMPLQ